MKRYFVTFLSLIIATLAMQAQTVVWKAPHVGYANNNCITIEKISFGKNATEVHAVITANGGNSVVLSSKSKLKSGSGEAPIVKVSKLKLDKEFLIPDSGKVHVVMSFASLPSVPDKLHFLEDENGGGWKLCNIRPAEQAIDSSSEYWGDEAYADDPDLPYTFFNLDSTTVNVKILNYTPEAGRTINLSYENLDYGNRAILEPYPIAEDGTVTIKLHPCFPITAFVTIGEDLPIAFILLVPGKDISILMDWEDAKDGFGMKSFKGAYARLHYQLNVLGAKDYIPQGPYESQYRDVLKNCPDQYLFKAFSREKDSIDNVIKEAYWSEDNKVVDSKTTVEYLSILSDYIYLSKLFHFSEFLYDELVKATKPISYNGNFVFGLFRKDVIGGKEDEEGRILLGNRMTICPMYSLIETFNHDTNVWTRGDASYNKSVLRLKAAIGGFRAGRMENAEEWAEGVVIPELKAYYETIVGRMKPVK